MKKMNKVNSAVLGLSLFLLGTFAANAGELINVIPGDASLDQVQIHYSVFTETGNGSSTSNIPWAYHHLDPTTSASYTLLNVDNIKVPGTNISYDIQGVCAIKITGKNTVGILTIVPGQGFLTVTCHSSEKSGE